ncbi:heme lyase NrfEFG subunit NrfF [Edwardsiella ictaluri]|uniref:Formate-dependent nitrite reductase complex subunit n=1 Tax=Edwardsiella ictaluri (strain 93-146) TaxID=634503 RepID=C5BER9_EDWI9|nr:heme lyase NrfEFG subunit NrfF [Edwardsiella ictaluri]ACR70307.1 cytochrome c nitrite reductase, accessory protein NrfF, putative [Edwardsiella ictaluri 93-146]AVZ82829.1 heme lyase NrfEFG subunit NrfF [Edwardsiella ictaluri]EKS7762507.1 heme lyase NrfEFG subunit NrfF [Edwardsiella ictaluri]EKS7770457.1 heme lyase NrfEFG subunit NrfF [Edwardsiella ictaluri]EKS7773599.1 heme lyase NrfEFG subunit NrfF [Edwardsiella ictaluri]
MRIISGGLWALLLLCGAARAQVVDAWAFPSPQARDQGLAIAAQLRCPQCQNQNLLESNAPVAVAMRHEVFRRVAQGQDEAQIVDFMAARYGEFVRYRPAVNRHTVLLWGLPPLLLLMIVVGLWRRRR